MWFADSFCPPEGSDVNKYETGSSIERLRPPSWEMDMTSFSAVGAPIWTKFGSLMQNNMQITAKWSRSKPE